MVGFRSPSALTEAIDAAAQAQDGQPSRAELIRRIVTEWLREHGFLGAAPRGSAARRQAGADQAKMAADHQIDRAQHGSGQSDATKADRKRRLTSIPGDLQKRKKP